MFELKKWEPLRELSAMQKEMDEVFKKAFGSLTAGLVRSGFKGEWCPDVDCYTKDNKFVVHADLPGVDAKDVDVSITGNILTIKGERKSEEKAQKGEYIFHESSYGSFERSMTLPAGADLKKVHASFKNGVLELTMPLKSVALPRKIKVELTEGKKGAKAA